MMRTALLLAVLASASALHLGGAPHSGLPTAKLAASSQAQTLSRTALPLKTAQLENIRGGAPEAAASPLKLLLLIFGW